MAMPGHGKQLTKKKNLRFNKIPHAMAPMAPIHYSANDVIYTYQLEDMQGSNR